MSLALSTSLATPLRIPTYFAKHPMRSPSWKWERAIGIANGTQPRTTARFDGAAAHLHIKRAVQFYRALQRASTLSEIAKIEERYPEIYWAYMIFEQSDNLRAIIDASVLARIPADDIASTASISVAAINTYEELFFDVRPRLQNEFYIVNTVIGNALQTSKPDADYAAIWKCYAYYMGPHVLRMLVSRFSPNSWCAQSDKAGTTIQDDMITTMKLKASIAVKTIPVNSRTQINLLNAFIKFVEVERGSEAAEASTQLLLTGVEELYTSMKINIGGRDPNAGYNAIDTGLVGIYDKGGVELRCDELLDVANGIIPAAAQGSADFPSQPNT